MLNLLKNWTLPVAMLFGTAVYLLFAFVPALDGVGETLEPFFDDILPLFMFLILFITFCKVDFHAMRPVGWHLWVGIFQVLFVLIISASIIVFHIIGDNLILLEALLTCIIGPCAAAAAVVTAKLGGNVGSLTAYTLLINLTCAVLISAFVPLVNPAGDLSFWLSFWMIVKKVFPLLIFPLFLGLLIRRISPTLLRFLTSIPDLPFYLWLISLSLAIAVTTRILVHAEVTLRLCLLILTGSLVACIMQFLVGRLVGKHYEEAVTDGQACGQKNTVLAIWVGYTFLNPLTSVAGGFYTIWHNVFNAWQLYRRNKTSSRTTSVTIAND